MSKRKRRTEVKSGWPKRKPAEFGIRLGFLLAEKDLTLSELAMKLGVSKQTVHSYKYVESPSYKTLHKIARALDVPVYFFFADDWVREYHSIAV